MSQNYQSLIIETSGHGNLTSIERDYRNYVKKERQLRLIDGKAAALQIYEHTIRKNKFFFSMQMDDEGRLKGVFWVEPKSKETYKEFEYVVTFDATYLTNKYDMLFTLFVGVNHRDHFILFQYGLISHEDIETFT